MRLIRLMIVIHLLIAGMCIVHAAMFGWHPFFPAIAAVNVALSGFQLWKFVRHRRYPVWVHIADPKAGLRTLEPESEDKRPKDSAVPSAVPEQKVGFILRWDTHPPNKHVRCLRCGGRCLEQDELDIDYVSEFNSVRSFGTAKCRTCGAVYNWSHVGDGSRDTGTKFDADRETH